MLLAANFFLNVVREPNAFEIAPWVDDKNNIVRRADQLHTYVATTTTRGESSQTVSSKMGCIVVLEVVRALMHSC